MVHSDNKSRYPAVFGSVNWLAAIRRYALFTLLANLIWEFLHLPLYTIWKAGTVGELAFAAIHCTGGDLLIALSALLIALCLFGNEDWPNNRYRKILIVTIILGICYTIFSEWLNIEIRQSWAYSESMPIIPIINAGLSPVLQWIIVPIAGMTWACRPR